MTIAPAALLALALDGLSRSAAYADECETASLNLVAVEPTLTTEDVPSSAPLRAAAPYTIKGPGTLESSDVFDVIASEDWSDDPGGVNPV